MDNFLDYGMEDEEWFSFYINSLVIFFITLLNIIFIPSRKILSIRLKCSLHPYSPIEMRIRGLLPKTITSFLGLHSK